MCIFAERNTGPWNTGRGRLVCLCGSTSSVSAAALENHAMPCHAMPCSALCRAALPCRAMPHSALPDGALLCLPCPAMPSPLCDPRKNGHIAMPEPTTSRQCTIRRD